MSRMAGPPVVGPAEPTSELNKLWSDASEKYIVDQPAQVRDAASKWAQNATAIVAVAGLATAFKGRETLDAVDPSWHWLLLLAVGAALLLGGSALLTAALATSGDTTWTWNDPTSFRAAQVGAAAAAGRWLTASKWLVVLAFAASLVAVGLVWIAPTAPTTPSKTLVIAGSTLLCGDLKVTNGQVQVDGQPLPTEPLSVHTVKDCPPK